jgi:hypothetical protein
VARVHSRTAYLAKAPPLRRLDTVLHVASGCSSLTPQDHTIIRLESDPTSKVAHGSSRDCFDLAFEVCFLLSFCHEIQVVGVIHLKARVHAGVLRRLGHSPRTPTYATSCWSASSERLEQKELPCTLCSTCCAKRCRSRIRTRVFRRLFCAIRI